MVRVTDLEQSLDFYCNILRLTETNRIENEGGRFTLVFLAAAGDQPHAEQNKTPLLELTYNWPDEEGSVVEEYTAGRNFGHLAFRVTDIYKTCDSLKQAGVVINRPPRDGHMAFVKSPDNISIELLQAGENLPPQEPWVSMQNEGSW
jgi:lactoylglutathione lyase